MQISFSYHFQEYRSILFPNTVFVLFGQSLMHNLFGLKDRVNMRGDLHQYSVSNSVMQGFH